MNLSNLATRAGMAPERPAELGSVRGGRSTGMSSKRWSFVLSALLLLVALPLTTAFGKPTSFGAGEGEGTLPAGVDLGTGLAMVGTLPELHALVSSVSGPGSVDLYALDSEDDLYIALFRGSLEVSLEQERLASAKVGIYLTPGPALLGGMAQAAVDNTTFSPFVLDELVYEMPIAALYGAPASTYSALRIFAMGPGLESYRFTARAEAGVLQLIQRGDF